MATAESTQKEMLTRLRQDLTDGKAVKTATKYYVSLPAEEAHHKSHKTGGMHARNGTASSPKGDNENS